MLGHTPLDVIAATADPKGVRMLLEAGGVESGKRRGRETVRTRATAGLSAEVFKRRREEVDELMRNAEEVRAKGKARQAEREAERMREEAERYRVERRKEVADWLSSEVGMHTADAADVARALAGSKYGFDTMEKLKLLVKRTLAMPRVLPLTELALALACAHLRCPSAWHNNNNF